MFAGARAFEDFEAELGGGDEEVVEEIRLDAFVFLPVARLREAINLDGDAFAPGVGLAYHAREFGRDVVARLEVAARPLLERCEVRNGLVAGLDELAREEVGARRIVKFRNRNDADPKRAFDAATF